MPRLLRRLKLTRVDRVDVGANPGAHITLFKRDPKKKASELNRNLYGERREEVPSQMATLSLKREKNETENDSEALEAELAEARKRAEQAEALAEELREKAEEKGDGVAASALRKKMEETEEELAELRKEKRMRHFVEQAEEFAKVAEPTQLGSLLEEAERVLSDDNQDFLTKILKAAKSASEVESTSKIFEKLSQTETEVEEWDVRLDKRAKEIADSQNITIEQAKVRAMDEDPELRAEYYEARKEQK